MVCPLVSLHLQPHGQEIGQPWFPLQPSLPQHYGHPIIGALSPVDRNWKPASYQSFPNTHASLLWEEKMIGCSGMSLSWDTLVYVHATLEPRYAVGVQYGGKGGS